MKVNQTPDDQLPLMFGSSGTRFGSKSRPTMISAKYRLKEERRKVLKISIGKLKKIEDPESSLRRSVLINNTVKRLQKEAREEKLLKQQVLYNSTSSCFLDDPDPVTTAVPTATTATSTMAEASVVSPLTTGVVDSLAPPASPTIVGTVTAVPSPAGIEPSPTPVGPVGGVSGSAPAPSPDSRKRPLLEDDCCDVLSQFYMPPTPRMLTSIDDEDEDDDVVVDVVDVEPPLAEPPGSGASAVPAGDSAPSSATSPVDSSPAPPKRPKFEVAIEVPDPATAELERRLFSCGGDDLRNSTCCWSATSGVPRVPAPHSDDLRLRFADSSKPAPSANCVESSTEQQQQQQQQQQQPQQYSCGHASIFGEIQSVVFHSLIASLES